jgi:hypothetical protein
MDTPRTGFAQQRARTLSMPERHEQLRPALFRRGVPHRGAEACRFTATRTAGPVGGAPRGVT